jgi:hypothetical protein
MLCGRPSEVRDLDHCGNSLSGRRLFGVVCGCRTPSGRRLLDIGCCSASRCCLGRGGEADTGYPQCRPWPCGRLSRLRDGGHEVGIPSGPVTALPGVAPRQMDLWPPSLCAVGVLGVFSLPPVDALGVAFWGRVLLAARGPGRWTLVDPVPAARSGLLGVASLTMTVVGPVPAAWDCACFRCDLCTVLNSCGWWHG